jgi:hypothetical protein
MDSILAKADNLFIGLMLDKSIPEFYSTVLQDKRNRNDAEIVSTKNSMTYSKTEPGTLVFGDENTFVSQYSHNSCLKYNENTKIINAAGEIGFGLNIEPCKLSSVGNFTYNPNNPNLEITADIAVKFFMQPAIASTTINQFIIADDDVSFVSFKRNKTLHKTMSVLTKDTLESNRLIASLYMSDSLFIPASLEYNFLLTGSKFYWDAQDASFKCAQKVSLAFFGTDIIKRNYNAYIELGYGYETDFINIYLQYKSGGWLFFKIKKGQMGIASSVPDIYNTITLLKSSERTYKGSKTSSFEFMPADLSMRDNFVTRMEDFKERFKIGANINKPVNTTITPADTTPIKQPAIAPEPKPVAPAIPKDDFKQKPKKQFSLDVPQPKTETPVNDTIIKTENVKENTSPNDSTTVTPKIKSTPKPKTK